MPSTTFSPSPSLCLTPFKKLDTLLATVGGVKGHTICCLCVFGYADILNVLFPLRLWAGYIKSTQTQIQLLNRNSNSNSNWHTRRMSDINAIFATVNHFSLASPKNIVGAAFVLFFVPCMWVAVWCLLCHNLQLNRLLVNLQINKRAVLLS